MKKYLIFISIVLIFFACKTEPKPASNTIAGIVTVSELLTKPDSFVNKNMQVKGTITHVCKHGGKKMFLMGLTEDQTLRVDAGKEMSQFDASRIGNDAVVTGVFVEQKVDEAFLSNWETEVKDEIIKSGKEIKATASTEEKAVYEKIGRHEEEGNSTLDEINGIRQQIKTNGKGYISWYSFEAKSYTIAK